MILVSSEDHEALSRLSWHIATNGYATNRSPVDGVKITIRIHNEVMRLHGVEIPDGMEVDHINRNRLDNRFENLRLCTRSKNLANKEYKSNSTRFQRCFKARTESIVESWFGTRGSKSLRLPLIRLKKQQLPETS